MGSFWSTALGGKGSSSNRRKTCKYALGDYENENLAD